MLKPFLEAPMTRNSLTSTLAALAGLGLPLVWAAEAQAQSGCASDADCPAGMVCEEVGGADCAGAPACPEGEECPEPEPCVPETYSECVPGPCTSDADCADGLVCLTETFSECTATDIKCAPGTECIPPDPVCVDRSVSLCAPKWVGPCAVDSDCGEGFTCVQGEMCECSGGAAAPAPPPDGDPAPVPDPVPEETCECYPTGQTHCEVIDVICETDADCPADWTCMEGAAETCAATPDGGDSCTPVASEKGCVPPYWETYAGVTGGDSAGATRGENELAPTAPSPQATSPSSRGDSDSEGGCQLAASPPASATAAWMLGLLALALGRRRRK
jgi:MYXO-CTERM domain-containing protein